MPKTATAQPPRAALRRSQAERSSLTRRRVCEATLQGLAEVGHERISTTMIAQKARVSRGALTHQFPARGDLFVAALRHLHEDWERIPPVGGTAEAGSMTMPELTELLWRNLFSDKRYMAAIELMLAARLDNDLGRRLREEMKRWLQIRDDRLMRLLGYDPGSKSGTLQLHLLLSVLRGIAVHQSFDQDASLAPQLLELWNAILGQAAPAAAGASLPEPAGQASARR